MRHKDWHHFPARPPSLHAFFSLRLLSFYTVLLIASPPSSEGCAPICRNFDKRSDTTVSASCVVDDVDQSFFTSVLGGDGSDSLIPATCIKMCGMFGALRAGIEGGSLCFCDYSQEVLTEADDSLCHATCSDGSTCGGDPGVLSVWMADSVVLRGQLDFSFENEPKIQKLVNEESVTVEVNSSLASVIDFGQGTDLLLEAGESYLSQSYAGLSGIFDIVVSQPKTQWEKSLRLENDPPPLLVMGKCDDAVEVTQITFCSVLLVRGNFTVNLRAAVSPSEESSKPESIIYHMVTRSTDDAEAVLGHATLTAPPGVEDVEVSPLKACGSVAVLTRTHLEKDYTLYAIEMLLAGPGAVALYVKSPKCKDDMALCPDGRTCSPECLLSCASEGFFNSLEQKCNNNNSVDSTISSPLTFELRYLHTVVVESEEPTRKKEMLKEPVILSKGDELAVGCADQTDLGEGKALARMYTRNASVYDSRGDQNFLVQANGFLGSANERFNFNHLARAFFTQPWSNLGLMVPCEKLSTPSGLRTVYFNITEAEVLEHIYKHTTVFTVEVLEGDRSVSTLPSLVTRCQVAIKVNHAEEFTVGFTEEVRFSKSLTKGTPVALTFNMTGTVIHGFIVDSGQNFEYEVRMPVSYPGHFPVTGRLYNLVSNWELNDTLHVVPLMRKEEWSFTCKSPNALPPGEISCNISAMAPILFPPWKLNLTISFGETKVHQKEWDLETEPLIPERTSSQPHTLIEYVLTGAGIGDHVIKLKASNEVSQAEWILQVALEEALDDFQCPSTYQPVEEDLVDMLIKPVAGKGKATNWSALWVDENKIASSRPITELPLIIRISKTDNRTLEVLAKNDMEDWKTGTKPCRITLGNKISGLKLEDVDITSNGKDDIIENVVQFSASFVLLHQKTCLVVSFGDATGIFTYGDPDLCAERFEDGIHQFDQLDNPIKFSHVYTSPKSYSVIALAVDAETTLKANLEVMAAIIPCNKTLVNIADGVDTPFLAPKVEKIRKIFLEGAAEIECSVPVTSVKSWRVSKVKVAEVVEVEQDISLSLLSTHTMPQLVIPPKFFDYGMYRFVYELKVVVRDMEVIKTATAYIEVVPSPLKVSLIQGALSVVTRGPGQTVDLEPYRFSEDPDNPEDKDFEFTWFCRSEDDPAFPKDYMTLREMHIQKANPLLQSLQDGGLGCFGDGPGAINSTVKKLTLKTSQFVKTNNTYEVMVMAQKKDRYALASLKIYLVTYKPPIPEIKCADEDLCRPTHEGILINPSMRLALRSSCVAECTDDMSITWLLTSSEGHPILDVEEESSISMAEVPWNSASTTQFPSWGDTATLSESHLNHFSEMLTTLEGFTEGDLSLSSTVEMVPSSGMVRSSSTSSSSTGNLTSLFPTGLSSSDLAISSEVFSRYPGDRYRLYLTLETPDKHKGETTLSLILNKPPTEGNCSLSPSEGLALIDTFEFICQNWKDPEKVGMGQYSFYTFKDESIKKTIVTSRKPDVTIVLPVGVMDIYCDISDIDGTFTEYHVGLVKVGMPSQKQYEEHDVDSLISELNALGNGQMTGMVLTAQASIKEQGEWFSLDLSSLERLSRDEIDDRLRSLAKMNTQALKNVEDTMSFATLQNLNIVGGVISSALDGISGTKEAAKTVDMEAREIAIEIMDKMIVNLGEISVPAPQDLTPFLFSTLGSMASIMEGIKTIVDGNDIDNVPPTDVDAALSWEYSVALTDDEEQEVPLTKEEMLQKNVMDTTKLKAKGQTLKMMNVVEKLSLSLEKKIVKGEDLRVETANGVSYAIQQLTEKELRPGMNVTVGDDGSEIRMPRQFCPSRSRYNNSTCDYLITITVIRWPALTHTYPESAKYLSKKTRVVDIVVTTKGLTLDIKNKTGAITVVIPRMPESLHPPRVVDARHPLVARFSYHQVMVEHPNAALHIEVSSEDDDKLVLLMDYGRMPTASKFELRTEFSHIPFNEAGVRELFLNNSFIKERTGYFYFGVASISNPSSRLKRSLLNATSTLEFQENLPGNYSFRVITSGCYYFNHLTSEWDTQGLKVLSANSNHTVCWSPRLGSFAAGYAHTPNSITFDYYHPSLSFNDYATLYSTVAIAVAVSVIVLVWARFKDRKDIKKRGVTPLPDNLPEDKYLYEIVVFTGSASEASCRSNVEFILSGEEDETEIRTLADYEREVFTRHGIDTFVMAVPRPLGALYYLRLWHDNSGPGIYSSWQVAFISVRDLQTGVETSFIANRWIAIDRDDYQLDVTLKAAQEDDRKDFGHLFGAMKQVGLKDRHLWFSIFYRPPRSRYTRKRRAAVCAAYLFLSMALSVLCYLYVEQLQAQAIENKQEEIEIGFLMKILIGLLVMAATYPPVLVLVFVFRRSCPRLRPESRSVAAIKAQHRKSVSGEGERPFSMIPHFRNDIGKESDLESTARSAGPCVLPWWCAPIAWIFVIGIITGSIYFVYSRSVIFDSTSMSSWCHSFITAFLASFLVVENLMVVVRAVLCAYCCKPQNIDVDDIDYDEKTPVLHRDEEWLHSRLRQPVTRRVHDIQGNRDTSALKELSDKLVQERAMKLILRDLAFYFIFLGILWVLSAINPSAIYMVQNLHNTFIKEGDPIWDYKNKVTNSDQYWRWLKTVMLDELRTRRWYNGEPPYGLRGFLDDKVNRIMGYAILRQIRLDKNKCNVPYMMLDNIKWCSGTRGIELEDSGDYCTHWKNSETITGACEVPEFRYKSAEELKAFTKAGRLGSYSGGGYVVELKGATSAIRNNLDFLHRNSWIDGQTRAILLEFSVYNANVKLFGICTIRAEFHPGGGIRTSWRFDVKELLPDESAYGFFKLMCMVAFGVLTIIFALRESWRCYKQGPSMYFKSNWNIAEVCILSASFVTILLFILRYVTMLTVVEEFDRTNGNGYVRLEYAAILDDNFLIFLAFVVFFSLLKIIKLLQFNRRMDILGFTLGKCWNDLKIFFIAFGIFFFTFVMVFHRMFILQMEEFSDMLSAAQMGFAMMLGKFNFEGMARSSPLSPIVFFVFSFSISVVLINIMLTIIIMAFTEVKDELSGIPNQYDILDYLITKFRLLVRLEQPVVLQKVSKPLHTIKDNKAPVEQFNDKMSDLIKHISNAYFFGQLDLGELNPKKQYYARGRAYSTTYNPALFSDQFDILFEQAPDSYDVKSRRMRRTEHSNQHPGKRSNILMSDSI